FLKFIWNVMAELVPTTTVTRDQASTRPRAHPAEDEPPAGDEGCAPEDSDEPVHPGWLDSSQPGRALGARLRRVRGRPLAALALRGRIAEAVALAVRGRQLLGGEAPVGDVVEPPLKEAGAVVLVVEVVGVLPQVAGEEREEPLAHQDVLGVVR